VSGISAFIIKIILSLPNNRIVGLEAFVALAAPGSWFDFLQ